MVSLKVNSRLVLYYAPPKLGIPTLTEISFEYLRPLLTVQELVEDVVVDFLKLRDPADGKVLQNTWERTSDGFLVCLIMV